MLLNGKNQLGLAFDTYMQDELFNLHYQKYIEPVLNTEEKMGAVIQIKSLFNNDDNINYFFRNTAIEIASRIKLDKGRFEDLSFITNKLPAKKCTFLMGNKKFYRWLRWGNNTDIIVICVKLTEVDEEYKKESMEMKRFFGEMKESEIIELIKSKRNLGEISQYEYDSIIAAVKNKNLNDHLGNGIFYYMWGIKNGKLHFPENEKNEDFFNEMMEFVKLLTFSELSELETVILPPKKSVGTKKEIKILNQSNNNVTIVDSTWNKILIKNDKFSVRGHIRLQPYGSNLQYRRLQYIDEYEKDGYVRKSKKEINLK